MPGGLQHGTYTLLQNIGSYQQVPMICNRRARADAGHNHVDVGSIRCDKRPVVLLVFACVAPTAIRPRVGAWCRIIRPWWGFLPYLPATIRGLPDARRAAAIARAELGYSQNDAGYSLDPP